MTKLLEDILIHTAKQSPKGTVRIVWVASLIALGTPQGGVVWDEQTAEPKVLDSKGSNYMQSKAGLVFLAHEFARRLGKEGIISVVSSSPRCRRSTLLIDASRYIPV